ncbi:DNA polymerase III subunit alpha [Chitinophaga cymbidii]|uniref:DNA-directed DNA polymerase n=1 Tax=Chitinophaga cymbidii TaxID=1096750 RepID=A0A512REM6_9BACT|nr:DNA polymerase III subunit alpha [Chitinophaga cymbidii]GEP94147.1 DNA-directed DNA polymerase [Chitinophaga cymbidii]
MYLNCKTWFSLRYGTISTRRLAALAREYGITSLALTNINATTDAWMFVRECREQGIKPVLGLECRNGHTFRYILLARNMEGWLQINRFLSAHLMSDTPFPEQAPFLPHTFAVYAWGARPVETLAPHELAGVRPREVNKLFRTDTKRYANKLVILQPLSFLDAGQHQLHRVLRAVDNNLLISQLPPEETAGPDECFISPARLLEHFSEHPHIVRNTLLVMEACEIDFRFGQNLNKKCFTGSRAEDRERLRELALEGMALRYGTDNREARERVEKELFIIDQADFSAYFLITWDITRYARHRGFFYVGRGSGANSIVAYCLQITNVDPIALDLYFERFLNPHRTAPPDFDIDFSWADRDDIIQYIFSRYTEEHTALMGTVATFQTNAIVRELGKVYGLPKQEIDKILENPYQVKLGEDSVHQRIITYGKMLANKNEAFPNHLSIHAGGILISEAPIHQYCATHMPPKGFSTAQMDMHMAEATGLHKFDILSQRGLGHIRDSLDMIRKNKGVEIDIHNVEPFMQDENVQHALRTVNTIGCFYIESPAMRQLLKKLECDDYITLVAASSIIRPGVAQAGMMRQYVQNFHAPDKVNYLHPVMKKLLAETYGVMVYQEDVIKVAHHYADLDLADADILRRAMAGKYRGEDHFSKIRELFFGNCARLGRPEAVSQEVWRQIASFANFSFSKAHSASFAVESYQSLYLKTYFPAEFMVAVINNFGGFYNRELYFRELAKTGVQIFPPCINNSDYLTSISGNDVFTGFIHVDRLEEAWIKKVLKNRETEGAFISLENFVERENPAPEQLEILIRIGAFNFTGHTKKELLWNSSALLKNLPPDEWKPRLFREPSRDWTLPDLAYHRHEDAFDEIELLGFPLCSPFEVLEHDQRHYLPGAEFAQHLGQSVCTLGYLVCLKHVYTSKNEPMCFGTFLDRDSTFMDTVHFPDSLKNYPFQKSGFYILEGKVIEEFGVYSLDVHRMRKIGYFEDRPMETGKLRGSLSRL